MRLARYFLLGLTVAGFTGAAQADTINTFTVSATPGYSPLTGTITIDDTSHILTSVNLNVGGYAQLTTILDQIYVIDQIHPDGVIGANLGPDLTSINVVDSTLLLGPPAGTPIAAYQGTLTLQTAATPEPSSLALFGTGLLGVIGAVRRKLG